MRLHFKLIRLFTVGCTGTLIAALVLFGSLLTNNTSVAFADHGTDPELAAVGDEIDEGESATVGGTIANGGSGHTFTLEIDWGDGSSVEAFNYPAGTTEFDESHTYVNNGVFDVELTLSDDEGGSATASTSVTVNNVAPVVTASGNEIDENSKGTVNGTISDVGLNDSLTLVVDWGDGSTGAPMNFSGGTTAYSITHTYVDDGVYVVKLNLTDDEGDTGNASASVTVNNTNPLITATGDEIGEGSDATVSGTVFDRSPQDAFTLDIEWGDGSSNSVSYPAGTTVFNENHTYSDNGIYNVDLTLTDDDDGEDTASASVTVNNVAPTITATGQTIGEGSEATISGTITDPGTHDTFTLDIEWGDGSSDSFSYSTGTTEFSESHTYIEDSANSVDLTITDNDGDEGIASTSVMVDNVAPSVTANGDTIDENSEATVSGTITDPGILDMLTLTISWGDGSASETFNYPAGTTVFSESHTYVDDGEYDVSLTITDDDGDDGVGAAVVTVNNVGPSLTATGDEIDENSNAIVSGTIADVGPLDTFALVIEWGDGASDTFNYPAGATEFSASHFYLDDKPTGTASDDYPINLTLTDDDGGEDTQTTTVTVNNVAPVITAKNAIINEAGHATITASIVEPGSQDSFTLVIDWGDGSPTKTSTHAAGTTMVGATHTYPDDNPTGTSLDIYRLSFTLTDDDGGVGAASPSVTVKNVAPTITASDDDIDEDERATVNGTITDPGSLDSFTLEIDWGDGDTDTYSYPVGSTSYSESHKYLDDNPTGTSSDTYDIDVEITDDDGGVGTASAEVTVNNVKPSVTATGDTISENSAATVSGTISDPGSRDTFTLVIDWDDGDTDTFQYPAGTKRYSESHLYTDDNPTGSSSDIYIVDVTVSDDDNGEDSALAFVTVNNVAPQITASANPGLIQENDSTTVSGSIIDPSPNDSFTLSIVWGDGSSTTYVYGAGTTSFSESHKYLDDDPTGTASDVQNIALTITDDDGGLGTASTEVTVENIAPTLDSLTQNSFFKTGTVKGTFSDVGLVDDHTIVID